MGKSKNFELARGVNAYSKAKYTKMTGRHNFFNKGGKKKAVKKVVTKECKWYPAEDVMTPLKRNFTPKTAKLRKSITPGTVLIVLSGRFRGKRCIFLKQLESGLLLVSGPYVVNGVPLRRLNQAYVIATSTKVDISSVKLPSVTDAFFKRVAAPKADGDQEFFDGAAAKKTPASAERKEMQKKVDSGLVKAIKKTQMLEEYLKARFSLKRGQYPHLMKF
jgi:large subunit ribosomal protein L6e